MQIDTLLAKFTRHSTKIRGMDRLVNPVRRFFTNRYMGRSDRWYTITNLSDDIRISVDRSSYMGGSIYWFGFHHRWELAYLRKTLAPGMVFIDVGANQGEFTLFASKYVGNGQVLAIEPQHDMFNKLEFNVALNSFSNVILLQLGIGNFEGSQDLYGAADTFHEAGWNEGLYTAFPGSSKSTVVQSTPIRRLDDVVAAHGLRRVDVIKIDVEGGELFVLQGAAKSLEVHKPRLILEINAEAFHNAGYEVHDIILMLQGSGYRFHRFNRGGSLEPIDPTAEARITTSFNILCQ